MLSELSPCEMRGVGAHVTEPDSLLGSVWYSYCFRRLMRLPELPDGGALDFTYGGSFSQFRIYMAPIRNPLVLKNLPLGEMQSYCSIAGHWKYQISDG